MYEVTVTRELIAQHFLTVPDPGPEGELHSHRFEVELALEGPELDEHDYLTDIDDVKAVLDGLEERYADATLNDLPEFEGYNPSVERFSRVVFERAVEGIDTDPLERVGVTIWEDDTACAGFERAV
jgi:6-pyruvoyltetrahydropterin/6-carboxytetrahydropterin synthase